MAQNARRERRPPSLLDIVFNGLAVVFFAITAYLLLNNTLWSVSRGGPAFLCAGLCALIGNMSRLESLKVSLSGIESKTREIISQAESALTELHALAATTGRVLIELIASEGRYGGGTSHAEKEAQKASVLATLKKVGLPAETIAEVAVADQRWNVIDYVAAIMGPAQARMHPYQHVGWNHFIEQNFKTLERPSPDELFEFITSFGLMTDQTRELIEDYRHYLRTKTHRRPELWMKGY